jgi:uncharacterized protein YqeY
MPLEQQINEDLKSALKAGRKSEVLTLRSFLAQVKDERIKLRPQRELIEDDVIRVLISSVKKRRESIELYTQGNRPDLQQREQEQIDILEKYMPAQMSEEEVTAKVKEIITQVGATSIKDLGKVMGSAMGQLKGQADGKVVQEIVRRSLDQLS